MAGKGGLKYDYISLEAEFVASLPQEFQNVTRFLQSKGIPTSTWSKKVKAEEWEAKRQLNLSIVAKRALEVSNSKLQKHFEETLTAGSIVLQAGVEGMVDPGTKKLRENMRPKTPMTAARLIEMGVNIKHKIVELEMGLNQDGRNGASSINFGVQVNQPSDAAPPSIVINLPSNGRDNAVAGIIKKPKPESKKKAK